MGRTNIAGINTNDATAVASDILTTKTAYVKGNKITGTMANQGAKTFTPSASQQTSGAGYYSSVKCNAVSNLSAENIKKGVSVGGVTGTYTNDATATASDILTNKTAYVNGSKVTGTMANQGAKIFTPSSSIQTSGAGYYSGITVNAKSSNLEFLTPSIEIYNNNAMAKLIDNHVVYIHATNNAYGSIKATYTLSKSAKCIIFSYVLLPTNSVINGCYIGKDGCAQSDILNHFTYDSSVGAYTNPNVISSPLAVSGDLAPHLKFEETTLSAGTHTFWLGAQRTKQQW